MGTLEHTTNRKISAGKYYPLGASVRDGGVNFAIYSQSAKEVFLLLFKNADDGVPTDVIRLPEKTRNIFHVFVHGIGHNQLYGYKVRGDYNPGMGLRFNENKLVCDPHAKALTHKFRNKDNLLLAYRPDDPSKDLSFDDRDNAAIVPKSIVIDDAFDWGDDLPLDIPMEEMIIYELHVKGFTADTSSGVKHPGTYLGAIEKIPYLTSLGITSVELLPVHEYYIDDFLTDRGLTNYWGYNTVCFFAPEQGYATGSSSGCQVNEFKTMVREFHKAGIEVILDVVFNHTAEGNECGPTLSLRGVDNTAYYMLSGDQHSPARYYMNYTGCGNTMNLASTPVIKLVLDSLRYWVEVMHVDGFRFDLASVLGREAGSFYKSASFFDAISQDPVLSRTKLIAEPWDLGSYEVGNFPIDWSEWNGKFRDTVRKFVKGDDGQLRDLGGRITGSADLYSDDGRTPYNSVNFVTCHDGFTLRDLVSYNTKHNEANREQNNDGSNDNNSWNCGAEGETSDSGIELLRMQQMKNLMCLLLLSLGTPMVLGGDEFGRTQKGNNNAYCLDNPISWFDWTLVTSRADLLGFFRMLVAFRRKYPVFRRRTFLTGADPDTDSIADIRWFSTGEGTEPSRPDWNDPGERKIAIQLDLDEHDPSGKSICIIYNMDWTVNYFVLPQAPRRRVWKRLVDTSLPAGKDFLDESAAVALSDQTQYIANPRTSIVLVAV